MSLVVIFSCIHLFFRPLRFVIVSFEFRVGLNPRYVLSGNLHLTWIGELNPVDTLKGA